MGSVNVRRSSRTHIKGHKCLPAEAGDPVYLGQTRAQQQEIGCVSLITQAEPSTWCWCERLFATSSSSSCDGGSFISLSDVLTFLQATQHPWLLTHRSACRLLTNHSAGSLLNSSDVWLLLTSAILPPLCWRRCFEEQTTRTRWCSGYHGDLVATEGLLNAAVFSPSPECVRFLQVLRFP